MAAAWGANLINTRSRRLSRTMLGAKVVAQERKRTDVKEKANNACDKRVMEGG
jgi:hypothetical protein